MPGRGFLVVLLFIGSGFPALIYQIVWQRSLFTLFGTDSVAVSVIVSAFMLGLGTGSLVGGEISRRPGAPLLKIFAALEFGTGLFALVSLPLFEWAGSAAPSSTLGLFVLSFLLVLVPTVMMGMTLPLLTTFLVRHSGLVGRSVGTLYAANTLGSALACFIAAYGLMPYLGKQQSLQVAAAINAAVGLLVLLLERRERSRPAATGDGTAGQSAPAAPPTGLSLGLGMAAAALGGFLSLGFEVAWFRLFSFATAGRADAFAVLLGYFLVGTAAGSIVAGWTTGAGSPFHRHPRQGLALLLVAACASGLLVGPLLALLAPSAEALRPTTLIILSLAPLVVLPAALFGMVLPLACDLSSAADGGVGRNLGRLYAANIVGATLGALAVGLVVMDVLPLRLVSVALLATGVVAAAVLRGRPRNAGIGLPLGVLAASLLVAGASLLGTFHERLQPQFARAQAGQRFTDIVENRSGIITVDPAGVVYGGGVYDGRLAIDVMNDINGIIRPLALSAVHRAPRRVLMIGLASGAWAQVVAHNPDLERLVIVEINPGYLEVVKRYPLVASLLRNPKVEIVTDDGRRWLKANPSEQFDAILMNTTFGWRNNATNLLSQEFLRLVASRLAPGGVALLNPTGAPEVAATALSVFPYAIDVGGSLFLGNAPLVFDRDRWIARLRAYRIDGRPLIDWADADKKAVLEGYVATLPVKDRAAIGQWAAGKRVITDDNMGIEWPRRSR